MRRQEEGGMDAIVAKAGDGLVPGLVSAFPFAGHREELMLYGQFVGHWDLEVSFFGRDGSRETIGGEWDFFWTLEGRAVADIWTIPSRAERAAKASEPRGLGITVRILDPALGIWRICWSSVSYNDQLRLDGRRIGSEIMQEGSYRDGRAVRWIFSDIAPASFRWRSEVAENEAGPWFLEEEMHARRP
jgi:hypothetical protein